ncbi:MAG: DUF3108 domain-containing protein [Burkholderiaceae bacterium]|jgi:hypothetical protein|nr:DUF3108 domain-containing protein [Burkholderiaceae bacterium]
MAGPLTGAARARLFTALLLLALLLHALVLALLQYVLQPPSLLRVMAPPLYTRTLVPEAPPAPAAAVPVATAKPNRPTALIRRAPAARKKKAAPPAAAPTDADVAAAPEAPASAALAEPPPEIAAAAGGAPPEPLPTPDPPAPAESPAQANPAAASAPAPASSAAEPAFLADWPNDTRLTYTLGGNYRGELHGDARVLWQRVGTRYQAVIAMSAGLLTSLDFSSQGEITAAGLRPEVFEENLRGRRRGVRLDEDSVLLNNGQRVPRPDNAQDTASQFAEIGHRLATGQITPVAGEQIRFALARPGGIDDWSYDMIGEETIHLPRLGAVAAWHVKPRPLAKPRGPLSMEMWLAPTLQYLPVRIRIVQDEDTYLDLLVQSIEQK